ncbi:hypothetical protein [Candidatus Chloroploca asiatica]|uniref:Uncharacterized protein n=1 Tax=Candidatus Chloroploca asiatica TaxID=1506545 RepID=A0A2H3KFL7_9CHLR|nr:hypothetical protein [Candidatus Chloroploca asiatica]PDV96484.1 hypothetical protein A9Q02_22745 [Candidatus Chloroploca asiatica]
MRTPHDTTARSYSAVIDHVQEVLLYGSADLAYWQHRLAPVGLTPTPHADRALLVLAAPALRWAGIPFRELTLGVFVGEGLTGTSPSGLYLASAYNSSRLLAWLERQFFQTPYTHRSIAVTATNPATITISHDKTLVLCALMRPAAHPLWQRDELWTGSIILPGPGSGWFRARLGGPTTAYRFDPAADTFTLDAGDPLSRLLAESQFTPDEWHLRTDAHHARSRTYRLPVAR